ncbi:MAG TPA: hypothetical protein VM891_08085 [Amaricoccus sp.]|jgi:hypothetical protein|nr:hypothetical protein [Amaricoccus sp.]
MTDTDTRSTVPLADPGSAETPDVVATVRDAGAAARDQVTETARSALDSARTAAADKGAEIKDVALHELDRTAEGLAAAAAELEGSPLQQDLLQEAAEGLKQISRAMQGKSIGAMVEEFSDFGRRNPLAFLGGAALAGFALARFAQASGSGASSGDASEPGEPRWSPEAPSIPAGQPARPPLTGAVLGGLPHG